MEKTKLPDYVVNSQAVENRLQEIDSMIESANRNLQTLKAEGIPTDLNTLKDILKDEDSFNKWLSKAEESYIGKIGFLPKEEKKRIHSTFSALLSRTDSARNAIHGLLFNRHGYNVLQDKDGNLVPDAEIALTAKVEGCAVLSGFGSGNPVTEEDYTDEHGVSYRGRAMAILRSGYEKGSVYFTVSAEQLVAAEFELQVI
jgi:hypothetical protein